MKTLITICLIAATAYSGCSTSTPDASDQRVVENPFSGTLQDGLPAFELELVQTFGAEAEPAEAILERVMSVHADDKGRLFVADQRQLVAFDDQGQVLWSVAETGEAPGEINIPYSVVSDGRGSVLVANQFGTRIDAFDLTGEFASSMLTNSVGYNYVVLSGFIDENRVVGVKLIPGRVAAELVIFNTVTDPWEVVRSFVIDQTGDLDIPRPVNLPAHITVSPGIIHVGSINRYEILSLSADGDTLSIVRRDVPDFTRIGIGRDEQRGIRYFSSMEGRFPLPSGRFLVWARWPTNVPDPDTYITRQMNGNAPQLEWMETLDLYEEDGTLLYSLSDADLGIGWPMMARADYIYTRKQAPYPHVSKYRVVEAR